MKKENRIKVVTVQSSVDYEDILLAQSLNHALKALAVEGFCNYNPLKLFYPDEITNRTLASWLNVDTKAKPEEVIQAIDNLTDDEIKRIINAFDYNVYFDEIV